MVRTVLYCIVEDSYDHQRILGVCSSKEIAEVTKKAYERSSCHDLVEIEEHVANEFTIQMIQSLQQEIQELVEAKNLVDELESLL